MDYIRRHVPWTRHLLKGEVTFENGKHELLDLLRREQDRMVLKPNDDYGGAGVVIGWDTPLKEWEEPPGCSAFYALSPVPNLATADIDWETEGPRYRDRILDYLEAHYLPGLRENLVTTRIFTPKDFESELNAWQGSAFSLEPVLTQSAWFRTHNRDDVIPNLYFVGAGTHPGAGVPGVVGSARATAGLMIADLAGAPRAHAAE